jgi:hypothetical protein
MAFETHARGKKLKANGKQTSTQHPATEQSKGNAPEPWGQHSGLRFGERWDPQADIAANVRRSQIIAIASSRAEKVLLRRH